MTTFAGQFELLRLFSSVPKALDQRVMELPDFFDWELALALVGKTAVFP